MTTKTKKTRKKEHAHEECECECEGTKEKCTCKNYQKKEQKIGELTDALQRLQAEFDNYRKRTETENQTFKQYAEEEFVKKLLPTIDNFELAFANKASPEDFQKGMELIYSQLFSTLEESGLKPIDPQGKFDPREHEALMTEQTNKVENNTITETLQKGYKMHDKVIRTAKVKVARR